MSKALVAAIVAIGSVVAMPAQAAAPLASWDNVTLSANSDNLNLKSFSAQSSDLYIQLSFTAAGLITANDFAALWLDKVSGGSHTAAPNIGIKADGSGSKDFMVRTTGTEGSFAPDLLTSGTTVTLWAHLYKSSPAGNYNTFDLWTNPAVTSSWSDVLVSAPQATSILTGTLSTISQVGFRTANLDSGDVIQVSGAIYNAIPAVPEPESYAMLLAGLGLMGTIARRRKSKMA